MRTVCSTQVWHRGLKQQFTPPSERKEKKEFFLLSVCVCVKFVAALILFFFSVGIFQKRPVVVVVASAGSGPAPLHTVIQYEARKKERKDLARGEGEV